MDSLILGLVLSIGWIVMASQGYGQADGGADNSTDEYDYAYDYELGDSIDQGDMGDMSNVGDVGEDQADSAMDDENNQDPFFDYKFSMGGKEDPFVPSVTLAHFNIQETKTPTVLNIPRPQEFGVVSELQKYPLQNLSVVGIWRSDQTYKVLVATPKAGAVIAGVGDFIGRKNGKIVDINKERILIREVSVSTDDVRMIHHQELYLQGKTKNKGLGIQGEEELDAEPSARYEEY